ncbi:sodium:proton antiporter [Dactylosporangium vinaceum]|uniref:Proton-conducting transporter membrane subunit n=1 Tax=Dactylosporangium vinaceum TaxID=53362 RepID=A0ABV5MAM8_9ACTN|nr:proton-conducting transporter membrane subunit [Dactylosporangium vinaceum]UAB92931.1 sodium:proton antiporter [Dactylosporangium vinaceum]
MLATVLLPGVVSLAVLPVRGRAVRGLGLAGTGVAVALLVLAGGFAVVAARHGAVEAVVVARPGRVWLGLVVDRLAALLLILIMTVSATAQGFAGRYLAGDRGRRRFIAATGLLTMGSAVLATGATLVTVAAGWTLAGAGLVLLLRVYPRLAPARAGARQALRTFAVGDSALWVAVGAATIRWGSVDLRHGLPAQVAGDRGWAAAVAGLIVVAALTRCAQVPWHRWLPASLSAPTPVSALLHAGAVNGGGVLLVRLAPITGAAPAVLYLAVAAGAVSLVYGTSMMLLRADVKGGLAYATTGQMGFMMMTAGLGWPALTVFHIVAHGLYKATLFLGSGYAVRGAVRAAAGVPPPAMTWRRRALGAVVAVAAAAGVTAAEAWRPYPGGAVLAVFVWACVTALGLGWLRRRATPAAALGVVAAVATAAFTYVAAAHAVTTFLALPGGARPAAGAVVAAVAGVSLIAALLRHRAGGPLAAWHKAAYVNLLVSGRGDRPRPAAGRTAAAVVHRTADPIAVGTPS